MQRYSTEDIIKRFEEIHHGRYNYSKFIYNGMHNKSIIICPIHGEFEQAPHEHLKGAGCKLCANKTIGNKLSYGTETFIEKAKKIHGDKYDYSKVEYRRSNILVNIICPIHGEFKQMPYCHLNGQGCPECGKIKRNDNNRNDIEDVINKIKKNFGDNYIYDNIKYINNHKKIKLICKKHGEFKQYPSVLIDGRTGCPECAREIASQKRIEKNFNLFLNRARKIHGDKYNYSKVNYKRNDIPIEIICPKHGSFWQKPSIHIDDKCGCPECAKEMAVSINELALREFLQKHVLNVNYNNRRILKDNKELDIYLPNNNLAIEFDGIYWHNEINKPDCKYHLDKTLQCANKGIQLIHIFEDEWIYKTDIVKSRLLNILGLTPNKIYARKCEIREVDYSTCKKFLDECHIQGNCPSKYRYGLFYNNELVSVMTFGSQRKLTNRKGSENDYELLRFCNKLNTTVIGGAGKLLKHFIKKHNPSTIVSYADRRWSNGNMYEQLGFTHIRDSKPNYFYVVGDKRENRFNYRKDILIKEGYDANKTEHEIMLERKIYRIYDCGCLVYELKLNNGISE